MQLNTWNNTKTQENVSVGTGPYTHSCIFSNVIDKYLLSVKYIVGIYVPFYQKHLQKSKSYFSVLDRNWAIGLYSHCEWDVFFALSLS